ncbi:MAG TPA: DUF4351 domain-containing protein [Gammaproteobacteria bacterium]|nr:DUF4351 domain-containing protein [Gammaproteobacteria bacterium]
MPSQLHEALVFLFRSRPALAPELLRAALHVPLPQYFEARVDSADLAEIQPAEYRADLVVLLHREAPALGIVVEVQVSPDERKRFVWPAYVANLRSRIKRPVLLLVVAADDAVARWAAKAVDLGGGNFFAPLVLRPSAVPEIADHAHARGEPELAVLSAMAHGRDLDSAKAARIAFAAQTASLELDEDRSRLYFDLVMSSLSDAARRELQTMDPAKYEYQSDFAKRYVAEGRAEGRAAGHAEVIMRQLTLRFGALPEEAQARIAEASLAELNVIAERLLTAPTLHEALGS